LTLLKRVRSDLARGDKLADAPRIIINIYNIVDD